MESIKFICPVCGYPSLFFPPRKEECGGSFEICPCCGFQFGVSDDDDGFTYDIWRQQWTKRGMKWHSVGIIPPPSWNPVQQLESLKQSQ